MEEKAKRPQLNLTPNQKLLTKLEELARTYRDDSKRRNEVALEILEYFWPHWEKATKAFRRSVSDSLKQTTHPKMPIGNADAAGEQSAGAKKGGK